MRKKTIKVRAGDGIKLPLPGGHAIDSNVTVLTPETPVEVIYDRYTRGRLAAGDMVEVEVKVETQDVTPDRPAPRRAGRE